MFGPVTGVTVKTGPSGCGLQTVMLPVVPVTAAPAFLLPVLHWLVGSSVWWPDNADKVVHALAANTYYEKSA